MYPRFQAVGTSQLHMKQSHPRAQHESTFSAWAARYDTWLLIKLKSKGIVFSCLFCFPHMNSMAGWGSSSLLSSLQASSVHFPLFIFHFLLRYRVPDLVRSPGFCSIASIQAYHNSTQVRLALTAGGMAGIACLCEAHQHVHRIHIALVLDVAACVHQEVMSVTRPGLCTQTRMHAQTYTHIPLVLDVAACIQQEVVSVTRPGLCRTHAHIELT